MKCSYVEQLVSLTFFHEPMTDRDRSAFKRKIAADMRDIESEHGAIVDIQLAAHRELHLEIVCKRFEVQMAYTCQKPPRTVIGPRSPAVVVLSAQPWLADRKKGTAPKRAHQP